MFSLLSRLWTYLTSRRPDEVTRAWAERRVERGARFLDETNPTWYRHVDPDTLELADGKSCVLGQLHGEFRMGLQRGHLINMSSAPRASLSPVSYGFKCVSGVPEAVQDRDYRYLNDAWREAIQARRRTDQTLDAASKAAPADAPTSGGEAAAGDGQATALPDLQVAEPSESEGAEAPTPA
jgi:hypothetical protein